MGPLIADNNLLYGFPKEEFAERDEHTVTATSVSAGGSGPNAVIGARRLGDYDIDHIGAIGPDALGELVVSDFPEDSRGIVTTTEPTGQVIMQIFSDGERK